MNTATLNAAVRTGTGKGEARKLRASGRIPGTVYGADAQPISVDIDPSDLRRLRKGSLGWNTPLSLSIDGADDVPLAILRDVQKHPLTGTLLHADFLRVDPETPVLVSVRIDLVGRAAGVALGGLLNRPVRRITVRCLPSAIPEAVVLDVTPLNIGDRIMIDEIPLPEGAEVVYSERTPVVMLKGRRGGAVVAETEEEETEAEAE